jgi:FlaA1/EpsC-like NDP-sugar epimerase
MSKKDVILIGAGGHARSCIDVIEQDGGYRVAGLIGKPAEVGGNCIGYKVLATDDQLQLLAKTYKYAL